MATGTTLRQIRARFRSRIEPIRAGRNGATKREEIIQLNGDKRLK